MCHSLPLYPTHIAVRSDFHFKNFGVKRSEAKVTLSKIKNGDNVRPSEIFILYPTGKHRTARQHYIDIEVKFSLPLFYIEYDETIVYKKYLQ